MTEFICMDCGETFSARETVTARCSRCERIERLKERLGWVVDSGVRRRVELERNEVR